jgi:hypothetical protein
MKYINHQSQSCDVLKINKNKPIAFLLAGHSRLT